MRKRKMREEESVKNKEEENPEKQEKRERLGGWRLGCWLDEVEKGENVKSDIWSQ